MRLVLVAGMPGSGKTSVVRECSQGREFAFIANNEESAKMMDGMTDMIDTYPFKSPCARGRQLKYHVDNMAFRHPGIMISEPPGNCLEVSAPMLNPIYVSDRDRIQIGPLITVMNGREILDDGISKSSSDGLRRWNMIDESDVIVMTFTDGMSDEVKKNLSNVIRRINPDARILFFGQDNDRITEEIFGDSVYRRPLYN